MWSSFGFVTPPGRPFTSLEKSLQPFQKPIWLSIIGVLLANWLFHWMQVNLRRSRIVSRINLQLFIRIYLGLDVTKYPPTIFSRVLIMILSFQWYILRCLYTGSLFYFLSSNLNYPPFERISDMLKSDMKFFIEDKLVFLFSYVPELRFLATVATNETINQLWNTANESDSNRIIATAPNLVPTHLHIASEKIVITNIVMLFPKFSYIAPTFDRIIQNCLENGVVHHLSKYLRPKPRKPDTHKVDQVTLHEIKAIVYVALFLHSCAFVIFLLEVASRRQKYLRRLFRWIINFNLTNSSTHLFSSPRAAIAHITRHK